MPAVEQLLDVFPACPVAAAGRVAMGELVDQRTFGTAAQDRVDVHLLDDRIANREPAARDGLEVTALLLGVDPAVGLHETDHDVDAASSCPPTFAEHRVRLADSGRGAEVDAQRPPSGAGRRRARRHRRDASRLHRAARQPLAAIAGPGGASGGLLSAFLARRLRLANTSLARRAVDWTAIDPASHRRGCAHSMTATASGPAPRLRRNAYPGLHTAAGAADRARDRAAGSLGYRLKKKILGPPLHTDELEHQRLGKPTALAVFASDNLSSSAYATEEILTHLIPVRGAGGVRARRAGDGRAARGARILDPVVPRDDQGLPDGGGCLHGHPRQLRPASRTGRGGRPAHRLRPHRRGFRRRRHRSSRVGVLRAHALHRAHLGAVHRDHRPRQPQGSARVGQALRRPDVLLPHGDGRAARGRVREAGDGPSSSIGPRLQARHDPSRHRPVRALRRRKSSSSSSPRSPPAVPR